MLPDDSTLPEPIRSTFVHEGNELYIYTWAVPRAPRVLLLHGIGMGHWVYSSFIEALREPTTTGGDIPFEVWSVDLPGFGEAPVPQEAASIAKTSDLVALSLAESYAGSPFIVVGHSMGAQVGAELAARHPNLVHRLVLIGTTVNPEERTAHEQAKRMIQDLGNAKMGLLVKGAIAYAQAGPKWFVEKLEPVIEHRMEDTLPRITQPTLVMRGDGDPVTPSEWSERVATLIPDAEHQEIEGHGHEAIIADGAPAVQTIRDWLQRKG